MMLCIVANTYAQHLVSDLDSLIAGYPSNTLDTTKNPDFTTFSGVVLIAKKDEVVFKKAFGKANLPWKVDNTMGTKFLIGSVTKTFTSLLTLQLVQDGKLALDDKLVDFIPLSLAGAQEVTIHHLLSHTSGLPQYGDLTDSEDWINDIWRRTYASDEVTSLLVQYINESEMVTEAGTEFQYNSLGYVLLGLVLEKASGSLFGELLDDKICNPLALEDTGFAPNSVVLDQFSNSYRSRRDTLTNTMVFTNADYRDRTFEYASGGIYSTIDDLYQYVKAVTDNRLLNKQYTALLFKANRASYAYGWWIKDPRYLRYGPAINIVSHSGAAEAYRANVAIVDEGDIIVIILSNVAPLATRKLTYDIIQRLQRTE